MKLAIHHRPGSWSDRWLERCAELGIEHERVNCYDTDIVSRLKDFDGLLWHFSHWLGPDLLTARNVLRAAQELGLAVFPKLDTCWHFDDKVSQKYALEALGAPLVPTYVFYDRETAMDWLKKAKYPLVAKLRRGAASSNVRLLESYAQAALYCSKMFGRGYPAMPSPLSDVKSKFRKLGGIEGVMDKAKKAPTFLKKVLHGRRFIPRENGYLYLQDFIANNAFDIRIAVVGDRAWGFRRMVRKNDWRASGSGSIDYDTSKVPPDCVRIAFDVHRKLRSQSTAFDFVTSEDGEHLIVEISYCYVGSAIFACLGHWDSTLDWHDGQSHPEDAILEDLLSGRLPND